MRLLTHNTLRNNAKDAKGRGFPLRITAKEIRVDDPADCLPDDDDDDHDEGEQVTTVTKTMETTTDVEPKLAMVRSLLGMLDWPALVRATEEMGFDGQSLPSTLSRELAEDPAFLRALYHILMNVHLVEGTLTCPETGREFPVRDGIPNMMIDDEDECER